MPYNTRDTINIALKRATCCLAARRLARQVERRPYSSQMVDTASTPHLTLCTQLNLPRLNVALPNVFDVYVYMAATEQMDSATTRTVVWTL